MGEHAGPGIYTITNTMNGKRYVGQAVSIGRRWRAHRSALSRGTHRNQRLLRAWQKYGAEAFVFEVLEHTTPAALTEREQHWMTELRPQYNIAPAAGTNRGKRISESHREALLRAIRGRPVSEETRRKIGEANRVNMLGRRHSEATKAKIGAAHRGKRRPDITEALTGRKRPDHVIRALRAANDARYAERVQRLLAAISAAPTASIASIARLTGCDRETVSKYKRQRAEQRS